MTGESVIPAEGKGPVHAKSLADLPWTVMLLALAEKEYARRYPELVLGDDG